MKYLIVLIFAIVANDLVTKSFFSNVTIKEEQNPNKPDQMAEQNIVETY